MDVISKLLLTSILHKRYSKAARDRSRSCVIRPYVGMYITVRTFLCVAGQLSFRIRYSNPATRKARSYLHACYLPYSTVLLILNDPHQTNKPRSSHRDDVQVIELTSGMCLEQPSQTGPLLA